MSVSIPIMSLDINVQDMTIVQYVDLDIMDKHKYTVSSYLKELGYSWWTLRFTPYGRKMFAHFVHRLSVEYKKWVYVIKYGFYGPNYWVFKDEALIVIYLDMWRDDFERVILRKKDK